MELYGQARITSVEGDLTVAAQIAADADVGHVIKSASYTDAVEMEPFKANDKLRGYTKKNEEPKLTLTYLAACSLDAGTQTIAAATAALVMPTKPSVVTLQPDSGWPQTTNDPDTDAVGLIGDWLYLGNGTYELTDEGDAQVTIPLVKPKSLGDGMTLADVVAAIA